MGSDDGRTTEPAVKANNAAVEVEFRQDEEERDSERDGSAQKSPAPPRDCISDQEDLYFHNGVGCLLVYVIGFFLFSTNMAANNSSKL